MAFVITLSGVHAAAAKDVKIGFVDFQKVLEESSVFQGVSSELEKEIKSEEEIFSSKREALQKKGEELEKQKAILSKEKLTEREDQLRKEFRDLQNYANDKQAELQRKNAEMMKGVLDNLSDIVSEIGKDKGYTSILERSTGGVVYYDESMDITDKVVKEYDKRYKK
jgi:outer membrane protein